MHNPSTNRGIVLVSVLWLLFLLCALAAAMSYSVRTQATIVHSAYDSAHNESALNAAIIHTIARLSDETPGRRPGVNTGAQNFAFDGVTVEVSVLPEEGRIDLNSATDVLIAAYLRTRDLSNFAARDLIDDLTVLRGANIDFSLTAPQSSNQRTEPVIQSEHSWLRSLDDLFQLPHWSTAPLDCWRDDLTVYTKYSNIDLANAGSAVALAYSAQRNSLPPETSGGALPPAPSATRSIAGHVVRIVAHIIGSKTSGLQREWVGRLTGDTRRPALTLAWIATSVAREKVCRNEEHRFAAGTRGHVPL